MVAVYWCIPRKVWSIRRDGRVAERRPSLLLRGCTMHIRERARLQVVKRRQRSVHAWVIGALQEGAMLAAPAAPGWTELGYNPYRAPTFTARPGFAPVHAAALVLFCADGRCYFREDPDA
jgi:hypothetical protein